MANFQTCIPFVLKHEGTTLFVDKINNERSKFGITERLLKDIKYLQKDPANLTQADAENIYFVYFWQPYKLQDIILDSIAQKIFDAMVNMGPQQATICAQNVCVHKGIQLEVDGQFGPITIDAINTINEVEFLQRYIQELEGYYNRIAVGNRKKYLQAWLARAKDC
jgi:lysozyme family protein